MNNKFLLPIIIIFLILGGGGIYYYYYNFIETVTQYHKIIFTPSRKEISIFGEKKYTEPKIEIKELGMYESDSAAVAYQQKDRENSIAYLRKILDEVNQKEPSDAIDKLTKKAELSAIEEMLSEWWIIVRVTHTRNFDKEKIKEVMKIWNDPEKIEEFNKEHKISVAIYPIY